MQTQTTRRTIPYEKLNRYKKRLILVDAQRHPVPAVLAHHHIDFDTLRRLKEYDRHLLDVELTTEDRITIIKLKGGTSGLAAARLGIPLENVNAIWPSL